LLDDIEIDTASGIIANFSGGDDLTFMEVADTLTHLHKEAGLETEIIPGVINNNNLSDRVQVILIVTGLGALLIDQAIPGAEKYIAEHPDRINENRFNRETHRSHDPHRSEEPQVQSKAYSLSQPHSAMITADLDVPAFLRKRIRG